MSFFFGRWGKLFSMRKAVTCTFVLKIINYVLCACCLCARVYVPTKGGFELPDMDPGT